MITPKDKFRPLLPKKSDGRETPVPSKNSSVARGTKPQGLPHKRQNVNIACENCRKRKITCNGVRPQCGAASHIYGAERGVDKLTTVAATSLMFMIRSALGSDKIAISLQQENAIMAQRLGLYGGSNPAVHSPLDLGDDKVEKAAAATAWGSFNFQMVMSMSYHQAPLPTKPPNFDIPRQTEPSSSDCTYAAVCQFWLIEFEMIQLTYSRAALSISSAILIFENLLGWADSLQEGVKRDERNPDHVLNLHIWFHTTVIDLFRPFAGERPQPRLGPVEDKFATPAAVIASSIQQLKRLVYQYRSQFESAKHSIIWQSGMLYLVNHILRDLSSNESQFYFLLCMRGYQHLARRMPFVSGVAQSLFAVALRQGTLLMDDAKALINEVRSENQRSQKFLSKYPVDLDTAAVDPQAATLGKLVEDFQELEVDAEPPVEQEPPEGWKGSTDFTATLLGSGEDYPDIL